MKKTRLVALVLLIALLLSACEVNVKVPGIVQKPDENSTSDTPGTGENENEVEDPENNEGENVQTPPDESEYSDDYNNEDITFAKGEQVMIVISDPDNNHSASAQSFITSVTEKWAITMTDDRPETANELVFGRCNRAVSRDAYNYLENYERNNKYIARFGFYSHGNSVAIAYDEIEEYEAYIIECAMKVFEDKYLTEDGNINLPAGTLYIETIDLAAYQAKLDEERYEQVWAKFTAEAGEEAAKALKTMYETLYSDDLIVWFANLYDVDIGGYYYSNSARDDYQAPYGNSYYDLLPDIESTAQALGFITSSGMASGLKEALPDWMQTSIIKFMKERQDPNGYFYHPQWTKAMVDSQLSRGGRDLSNATGILAQLGASPTYNTPTGVYGDGLLWDGTSISSAASALTLPVNTSMVASVSRVVATAAAVPSHLENDVAFRAYLKNFEKNGKIDGNSYWIGNQLASQAKQIVARDVTLKKQNAGYQLADILAEWLDGLCYETTGHWEPTADYAGLNGLMKISSAYEGIGKPLPYPEAAVRSAIATIDTDEENGTVCYNYNSWFAIGNIIDNVKKHRSVSEANELVSSIRAELKARAPELIAVTMQKQGIFKRSDGSFSYTVNGPAAQSQGMPVVSQRYSYEGDVNATVICTTGTLGHMFKAFGFTNVPIFYRSDLNTYLDIIEANLEARNAEFNYAETEKDIKENVTNFKISSHTNSETGVTAPVIRIYNSHLITDVQVQKAILRHIFNTEQGRAARLSEADLDYYIKEWSVHNYMYNNPSSVMLILGMTEEEVKERSKHVDLNTNDERKSIYETIENNLIK